MAKPTVSHRDTSTLPPRYISIYQTAEYLCVDERTVRNMINDGRLTAYKLGGVMRLRITEIDAAFDAGVTR